MRRATITLQSAPSSFSLLPQATDCAPDSDGTSSAAKHINRIISILYQCMVLDVNKRAKNYFMV